MIEENLLVENLMTIMLGKLRANCFKAHWQTMDNGALVKLLVDEFDELKEAVHIEEPSGIAQEAADIANICAMIAWNSTEEMKSDMEKERERNE